MSGAIKAVAPTVPLYWFLPFSGHRTYRVLPTLFNTFFPAHNRETPQREMALMDQLARERFGDAYDSVPGVVRFYTSLGRLKPSWADVPAKDRPRADVLFFLERNPGYVNGDELVCLAELAPQTLRPLAERLFRKGMEDAIK